MDVVPTICSCVVNIAGHTPMPSSPITRSAVTSSKFVPSNINHTSSINYRCWEPSYAIPFNEEYLAEVVLRSSRAPHSEGLDRLPNSKQSFTASAVTRQGCLVVVVFQGLWWRQAVHGLWYHFPRDATIIHHSRAIHKRQTIHARLEPRNRDRACAWSFALKAGRGM